MPRGDRNFDWFFMDFGVTQLKASRLKVRLPQDRNFSRFVTAMCEFRIFQSPLVSACRHVCAFHKIAKRKIAPAVGSSLTLSHFCFHFLSGLMSKLSHPSIEHVLDRAKEALGKTCQSAQTRNKEGSQTYVSQVISDVNFHDLYVMISGRSLFFMTCLYFP